jgi:hypothetical protein
MTNAVWFRENGIGNGVNLIMLKKMVILRVLSGLIMIVIFTIVGCATPTVVTEYGLPSQNLEVKPEAGLSKVVFFNNSNFLTHGIDQSGYVTIKINGKGLATLQIHTYVQIFLEKGEYDLYMAHLDVLLFESNHKLRIDKDEVFVEVSASITSNEYKIVDRLPANFIKTYKPVDIVMK